MLNKREPNFEEPVAGNPHGGFCEELASFALEEVGLLDVRRAKLG